MNPLHLVLPFKNNNEINKENKQELSSREDVDRESPFASAELSAAGQSGDRRV